MNSLSCLIFVVVAVLGFYIHGSIAFESSLCLEDTLGGGCQTGSGSAVCLATAQINRTINPAAYTAYNDIQDAYDRYNASIKIAQNKAVNGIQRSLNLQKTNPKESAKNLMDSLNDCTGVVKQAMTDLHLSLGAVLGSTGARSGLEKAIQKTMLVELDLLDRLEVISSLANPVLVKEGGNSAFEGLKAASLFIQAGYRTMLLQSDAARNIALNAISGGANQQTAIQNTAAAEKDSDTLAALKEINRAASDAVRRGVAISKVESVRKSFVRAVVDVAEADERVKEYFNRTTALSKIDRAAARDMYLSESRGICNVYNGIGADVILTIGSISRSTSSQTELKAALNHMYRVYTILTVGNKNSKRSTLFGYMFDDDQVRDLSFGTSLGSGRFGKMAFVGGISAAAGKTLSSLWR